MNSIFNQEYFEELTYSDAIDYCFEILKKYESFIKKELLIDESDEEYVDKMIYRLVESYNKIDYGEIILNIYNYCDNYELIKSKYRAPFFVLACMKLDKSLCRFIAYQNDLSWLQYVDEIIYNCPREICEKAIYSLTDVLYPSLEHSLYVHESIVNMITKAQIHNCIEIVPYLKKLAEVVDNSLNESILPCNIDLCKRKLLNNLTKNKIIDRVEQSNFIQEANIDNLHIIEEKIIFMNQNNFINLFGPCNPSSDRNMYETNNNVCNIIGCRMMTCNCYSTIFEEDDDDKIDGPNNVLLFSWFIEKCQICRKRINSPSKSIRMPKVSGSWYGCFCSKECVIKYSSNLVRKKIFDEENDEDREGDINEVCNSLDSHLNDIKEFGIYSY